MHIKTVKRYYCEHCNKSGGSSYHMRIHESHCTLNPNRKCRMCQKLSGTYGFPVNELVEILGDGCNQNFDLLWDHVEGCPACILSAIRQSNILKDPEKIDHLDFERYSKRYSFDFKESCRSFWSEVRGDGYL